MYYLKKGASKKVRLGFFKICKYTFFNILKTGQAKKLCQGFLRFVNILFLTFEKEDSQKNVHG